MTLGVNDISPFSTYHLCQDFLVVFHVKYALKRMSVGHEWLSFFADNFQAIQSKGGHFLEALSQVVKSLLKMDN